MKLSRTALTSAALACFAEVTNAAVQKICTNYTIPVQTNTTNMLWANPWKSNYDLVDFISNFTAGTEGNPYATETVQSTGNYNISATFCSPARTSHPTGKNGTVLLLNHGLNFDRSYVDALHIFIHD
jgi:hypothetical protein